jgi:hypothetical protein
MSNDQQYAAPFRDRKSSHSNMHIHVAVASTGTCSVALRCSTSVTISTAARCWSRPPRPYCAAALPAKLIASKRFSERTNLSLERLHNSANGHCSHAATKGCNGSHSACRTTSIAFSECDMHQTAPGQKEHSYIPLWNEQISAPHPTASPNRRTIGRCVRAFGSSCSTLIAILYCGRYWGSVTLKSHLQQLDDLLAQFRRRYHLNRGRMLHQQLAERHGRHHFRS